MVESILTFFVGCAVTGALVGFSASVYLYFSADLRSVFPVTPLQLALTGPIVVGITTICFGTIPFMCVAAVLRKVWSPAFLKRGGFVTGLLFGPGFLGFSRVVEWFRLPFDTWSPRAMVAASFTLVPVIIASYWAVAVLAQSKARQSEAGGT